MLQYYVFCTEGQTSSDQLGSIKADLAIKVELYETLKDFYTKTVHCVGHKSMKCF